MPVVVCRYVTEWVGGLAPAGERAGGVAVDEPVLALVAATRGELAVAIAVLVVGDEGLAHAGVGCRVSGTPLVGQLQAAGRVVGRPQLADPRTARILAQYPRQVTAQVVFRV